MTVSLVSAGAKRASTPPRVPASSNANTSDDPNSNYSADFSPLKFQLKELKQEALQLIRMVRAHPLVVTYTKKNEGKKTARKTRGKKIGQKNVRSFIDFIFFSEKVKDDDSVASKKPPRLPVRRAKSQKYFRKSNLLVCSKNNETKFFIFSFIFHLFRHIFLFYLIFFFSD